MLSLGDLLNPLALSGHCEDPEHRQLLMGSVLQLMTGRAGPWPHDDPVWASLLPLIPQGTHRRTLNPDDPSFTFSVPLTLAADQLGQLITLPWLLGGELGEILGEIVWHQPLTVQVRRDCYDRAKQPIPVFLRAYDGLRLLGVTAAEAQRLVEHSPGDLLLEVVTFTYRRRAQLDHPPGYLRAVLAHRLARHLQKAQRLAASKCGHEGPIPLSHSLHVPAPPALSP
ncbi:hypothetical protein [Deinococcus sp. QL22]|uniref:hypothetical protein n=1 Tax=Deinococcus sp. QL22 TaxID=2939437 RepID=UPI002017EAF4|nr:hypothetical protein [Deinococcus sp. QL22]UQN08527.1 hypothetical protein M1R55_17635 [Deinococcus sp. QL22]